MTATRKRAGWEFGDVAATDEDWASPQFDYLQSHIGRLLDPDAYPLDPDFDREAEVQRWRDARPFLIAHIRRNLGDPKWDPRGARVVAIKRGDA